MTRKRKNQKYYKNRRKRKLKKFYSIIRKSVLTTAIILIIIFTMQVFLTPKSISCGPVDLNIVKTTVELQLLEPMTEGIMDFVKDFQNIMGRIIRLLKAAEQTLKSQKMKPVIQMENIPPYWGEPYVMINNNIPMFTKEEITKQSYEFYSELDLLGRCGMTMACIGKDLMPLEERGPIGMIRPSGWKLKKYDIVDGKYIYNRCHLIGFQLTGENANEKNLITGTRYLNVEGMLPFENETAEYIRKTGNHVMYRVTPIFEGNNLVASGVQMEALSVEDDGKGICFNLYVYNVQPGIEIDYKTGDNWLIE